MGLMHPMYNHQGRSRKVKRKKTASLLAAEKKHNAWLKSMGLDKRTKREPQTMITVNYHTEQPIEKKETFIQRKLEQSAVGTLLVLLKVFAVFRLDHMYRRVVL